MRRSFMLSLIVIFAIVSSFAQKTAITTDGKEVYLYDNGTWKYSENLNYNIQFFTKQNSSRELRLYISVKGKKYDIGKWFKEDRNGVHQVTSTDIVNEKTSEYEAYAEYSNTSGYTVRYYAIIENDKVKVFKYYFHHMMPEEDTELVKVIN